MTTIVKVLALLLIPVASFSQNAVADLEKKYNGDNSFSLQVTGNFLHFLEGDGTNIKDPEIREFIKKLSSLRILAVSNRSKGYSSADIKNLKREIKRQHFDELMSVKSDNGQLQLVMKDRKGEPSQMILILDKNAEGFVTVNLASKD